MFESILSWFYVYAFLPSAAFAVVAFFAALAFRRVVPANEVHILQKRKKTVSYGKGQEGGNSYHRWPVFLPLIGVQVSILPTSVFAIELENYEAYDKGRLPFMVDVLAFFRISDSNVAAQKVSDFAELKTQLNGILQGAIRSVLASNELHEIMEGRGKFGDAFTKEVNEQLANWGVETVKSIELMDIKDADESHVIHNIMDMKKTEIEANSRKTVANNHRDAEVAEALANQIAQNQRLESDLLIQQKKVANDLQVGKAKQKAEQEIKELEIVTKEKQMEVARVEKVKQAEMTAQAQVVAFEMNKKQQTLMAEGERDANQIKAEGIVKLAESESKGIELRGVAEAEAEKAKQMATVAPQISLAKEIGQNKDYQQYLITIEQIKANKDIGVAQAENLAGAEIKIIANAGTPVDGVKKVTDLFNAKGGTDMGMMMEGFAQTDLGKKLIDKIIQ